jgi:hypothetical protein
MWTVDELVDKAIQESNASPNEMVQVSSNEANKVVKTAMDKFIEGNPRVWWLSLKTETLNVSAEDSPEYLKRYWPPGEKHCYFIPENETDTLRVFEATLEGIIKVLKNSIFYEYYLVGKQFNWLIIETDHNELLIAKDKKDATNAGEMPT